MQDHVDSKNSIRARQASIIDRICMRTVRLRLKQTKNIPYSYIVATIPATQLSICRKLHGPLFRRRLRLRGGHPQLNLHHFYRPRALARRSLRSVTYTAFPRRRRSRPLQWTALHKSGSVNLGLGERGMAQFYTLWTLNVEYTLKL